MTGINHKQAQRYLRAAADGLLRENQRALLDAHLRECDSCRAEADELNALEARLKKNFQARWDAHDGPSTNVMTTIHSRSRRIIMTNRINTGLKVAAGLAALLLLTVLLNSLLGRFRISAVPASATQTNETTQLTQVERLIAFASMQDYVNGDIFTMQADGSEVTNLTNNPATDESPAWSPDGTRIAFVSDRSGDTDIYVMNSDGSNVSRLTDDRGFEGYFSWSPDGQRIVYTASENSLNLNGRLMVMNADGSNKIPLMDQPGSYTFLGWSPDGKTIVYQATTNLGDTKDTRIMSANVDGTNTLDGPYFEGDSGRRHYQIHWETPEQFITVSLNSEQSTWGRWNLTRFFTTGDYTNYNGNNPILVTSDSPIVAIFDKTYVVESQDSLTWFVYDGAPIPLSPWKFSEICKTPGDPNLLKTSHTISPDGKYDFVSFYCGDDNGSVSFFLMNEDGTEIHQLGKPITNTNFIPFDVSWSSDGKYVTLPIADRQNQDIYLFDIEKMLNDPTTQPVQLTTDGGIKYGAVWQPQLKEEPVVVKATEEKPIPVPTQTPSQIPPLATDKSNGEWIAFIGGKVDSTALDITQDIYLIHPDGTGLINITNNKDHIGDLYMNLQWSPDGKNLIFLRIQNDKRDFIRANPDSSGYSTIARPISDPDNYGYSWSPNSIQIAFADASSGNYDIYTVYADGRNDPRLRRLTDNPAQDVGFVWSPDGSQIAYQRLDGNKLSVYIMNADGSDQREVAKGAGKVNLRWSQDGMSIYASTRTENDWLDCETCVHKPGIYRIYLNVIQVHQIHYEQDASKVDGWYLYDTLQDTLYFMRIHHSDFLNFQGVWSYADGNSIHEIGELDPHQTCKTTTGNILNEYISPNERYSIISDFCVGGFDLYLADRESPTPEKQITHLLRLPLSTRFSGEGGDGAYLPIFWSPDGRTIMYSGNSGYGAVIYLLDIEMFMQDPTTKLIPLTKEPTELSNFFDTFQWFGEFQWQPRP